MVKDNTRTYNRVSLASRGRIVELRAAGQSIRQIALQLKLKPRTVHAVVVKWNLTHNLEDEPKSGRPQKFDAAMKRQLCRMMLRGEVTSATELAGEAHTLYDIDIGPRSVRNMLHEEGIEVRHTIKKPRLTREHKRKRLDFARAHSDWTVEAWKQVIFSDETTFTAYPGNMRHLIWTRNTTRLNPQLLVPTVQGGGSKIMIWGCISTHGFHDLKLLEGKINADCYIEVLEEHLLPIIRRYFEDRPCIFQHDGASVHTAHAVRDFLEGANVNTMEWPPNSPDLNIIEHLWYYMKVMLHRLPPAGNKDKLWDQVSGLMDTVWGEEMTETINNLYESLPRRMAAVIRVRGGNTKY